jgi:hypothetical protein
MLDEFTAFTTQKRIVKKRQLLGQHTIDAGERTQTHKPPTESQPGDPVPPADLPAPVQLRHLGHPESQPIPQDTGAGHDSPRVMDVVEPVTPRPPPSNIHDESGDSVVPEQPTLASSYPIDQPSPMIPAQHAFASPYANQSTSMVPEYPAFAGSYAIDQSTPMAPENPAFASLYTIDQSNYAPVYATLFEPS